VEGNAGFHRGASASCLIPQAWLPAAKELFNRIRGTPPDNRQLLKGPPERRFPLSPVGCSWDRWRWNCSAIPCTPRPAPGELAAHVFRSIPANDKRTGSWPGARLPVATEVFPIRLRLLLPLSGRAEAVGVAVRDGFHCRLSRTGPRLASRAPESTTLRRSRWPAPYQQAIQDWCRLRWSDHLTKEDVAAIVPALRRAPRRLLALNFLADGGELTPPQFSISFALVAGRRRHASSRDAWRADGKLTGRRSGSGRRMGKTASSAAFADELTHLGGAGPSTSAAMSRAGPISRTSIKGRPCRFMASRVNRPTHRKRWPSFRVRRRQPGRGAAARVRSSSSTSRGDGPPPYSTSDSFETRPRRQRRPWTACSSPTCPWMVSGPIPVNRPDPRCGARRLGPARTGNARGFRLYAFRLRCVSARAPAGCGRTD